MNHSWAHLARCTSERRQHTWKSVVYAFFEARPTIEYTGKRVAYVFRCAKPNCVKPLHRRFLDTQDIASTSFLWKHVRSCWGKEAVAMARKCACADDARPALHHFGSTGLITTAFERAAKSVESYSTLPMSKEQTLYALSVV